MALHLADFFIIQAAITIAVHLLEHRYNAALKHGFIDHAIIIDVDFFAMNLPRLSDASSISA